MDAPIQSLFACLQKQAEQHPTRKFLGGVSGWLTTLEAICRIEAITSELLRLGIAPGDFIILQSKRCVDTCLLIFALEQAGAVVVLANPRKDVVSALNECSGRLPIRAAVFCSRTQTEWHLRDAQTGVEHIVSTESELSGVSISGLDNDPKAPSFIIFTSGSTGESKSVVLSQHNLISNIFDAEPLGDYRPGDIALGALPLEHVFGLVLLVGAAVLGYSIYFPEKMDIPCILNAIDRERITRMNGVPSLYFAMAEHRAGYDLSSLRAGFIGGGPCTLEQFISIENALDMTLIPAYGMSECVGITSASWQDPQSIRARSVGRFYARNTGKILRADGLEADPGEEGEICVDSHTRMLGYYGDASPREPLLHTGDLGYIDDDGFIYITGRKKEIIIRNGVNLSPRRIEAAMLSIPGVEDAAVVGLPDAVKGELPWAMAVCREELRHAVLNVLREKLAKNECPAGVLYVDALPMTPSGKPDKQKIREVLARWKKA